MVRIESRTSRVWYGDLMLHSIMTETSTTKGRVDGI